MRNNKPIPRHKLRKGMRIKIPWNGNWWGSNKKYVWFKGTIIELSYNHAIISLRKSHGINKCFCCGSNLDYIYKQL
jgi:hypothetical protein